MLFPQACVVLKTPNLREVPTGPCCQLVVLMRLCPLMRWGAHGPMELASELLPVVYVDVVKHVLVHHVGLRETRESTG